MTTKQKEDLAGLLSRMAEIEAIFQGMDAADYEALKDTAEVKAGLANLETRVNNINYEVEISVSPADQVTSISRTYTELVQALQLYGPRQSGALRFCGAHPLP